MRKMIEYTLVSVDGVYAGAAIAAFAEYRDDAYMWDGLGQALACDALLMGRTTYEDFARICVNFDIPWAEFCSLRGRWQDSSRGGLHCSRY